MYNYIKSQPKKKDRIYKVKFQIDEIKELSESEKIILSQIIFFEGLTKPGEIKEHRPKNKYLANLISKSERTVQRCIKHLEELGYLVVTIYDRCDRALTLCTEKIAKILSQGYDTVSEVIDNLSSTIIPVIQSITAKTRTFFKRKENKETYKKGNFYNQEEKRIHEVTLSQEQNQSREEFDKYCNLRESEGVIVKRIYLSNSSKIILNAKELMLQGFNNSKIRLNLTKIN